MVSYTPLFTTLTKKGMTKTELRKKHWIWDKCTRKNV